MKYTGVVFDFNGTLFWDTKLHNKAWSIFLSRHNMSLSEEEMFRNVHGKNNKDIFQTLFPDISQGGIADCIAEKEGIYQQLCLQTDMRMAPGAIDFFNFLKENGIPFTIATASGRENLDFYFKHLPLSQWFDYDKIVYNNGKIKGKPDPQIYQLAMDKIGRSPDETIVFEDANMGLLAARNAHVGRIIVVDSNDDDYGDWSSCQKIKNFDEVDRYLFL